MSTYSRKHYLAALDATGIRRCICGHVYDPVLSLVKQIEDHVRGASIQEPSPVMTLDQLHEATRARELHVIRQTRNEERARLQQFTDAAQAILDALATTPLDEEKLRMAAEAQMTGAGKLYLICERCNHNDHRCPGCGDDLPHGTGVCTDCKREHQV